MREKSKKTKKISTNSKNLLEVLRENNPLNLDYWNVKNELTLGECILIFYDIEPIPSLSNTIDTNIYSMIFEHKQPQKISSKELIEKVLSSNYKLIKEVFKTDLPNEMTELEFILIIDEEKICSRFINRWAKSSAKHKEISSFLDEHRDDDGNQIYYYFSKGLFALVSEWKKDLKNLFLPASTKDNFGNILLMWGVNSFEKFPITIEKENFDTFDFKWLEFRKIDLETNSKETNAVESEHENKKNDIRSSFKKIVEEAVYAIYRTNENKCKKTEKKDVLNHPFMKKILQAIKEHTRIKDEQIVINDNQTNKDDDSKKNDILDYELPEERTIVDVWIHQALKNAETKTFSRN